MTQKPKETLQESTNRHTTKHYETTAWFRDLLDYQPGILLSSCLDPHEKQALRSNKHYVNPQTVFSDATPPHTKTYFQNTTVTLYLQLNVILNQSSVYQ